jgi:sugar lactone lactonase YvrE
MQTCLFIGIIHTYKQTIDQWKLGRENEVLMDSASHHNLANEEMEMYVSSGGNAVNFTTDKDDNIYLAYQSQNRIEKYDKKGGMLFMARRPLGFKTGYGMKTEFTDIAISNKVTMPKFRYVSRGIQIDHKNRIWVLAHKNHADDYDKVPATHIYELEI